MDSTRTSLNAALAVAVFIAAIALVGGFGGSETTYQTETFEFVVEDHSAGEGIVVEVSERGGFGLFGLAISQPDRFVRVAFTLPHYCDLAGTQEWPITQAGCEGPDGLVGTIAGSGITAAGGPIVLVEAPIDAGCFSRIELGAAWPPIGCAA